MPSANSLKGLSDCVLSCSLTLCYIMSIIKTVKPRETLQETTVLAKPKQEAVTLIEDMLKLTEQQ